MKTVVINAKIYTGREVIENGYLILEVGEILAVGTGSPGDLSGMEVQDLAGQSVAPAFIDLQVYGGNGCLFNNDPTVHTIEQTYASVREGGGSHFQITLSCSPPEVMEQAMAACREYQEQGGAGLIGLHLEGPWFNPVKRGAHPEKYIQQPTASSVKALLEQGRGVVSYITLAPEQFDEACWAVLAESKIPLSAGHSNASFATAIQAFDRGIQRVTHLFNAMSQMESRSPGLVGATFRHKPWASIIADGIHCDFEVLRVAKDILGEKLFLITDAVTTSEKGDYNFHLAGDRYLNENGTLAGAALTMWKAVQNVVKYAGIPLEEALRMAATYPAQVVGLEHRLGYIAPGFDAGLIVFSSLDSVPIFLEI